MFQQHVVRRITANSEFDIAPATARRPTIRSTLNSIDSTDCLPPAIEIIGLFIALDILKQIFLASQIAISIE